MRPASGHRNVPQSNFASLLKRPYHQLPENRIGLLPWMKETPASSALRPLDFLSMYPFFTQSAKVSAPYVQAASWKSIFPLYSS